MTFILSHLRTILFIGYTMFCFGSGYWVKSAMVESEKYDKVISTINTDSITSHQFETDLQKIEATYDNIDISPTYMDGYDCVIPADGVRIIKSSVAEAR